MAKSEQPGQESARIYLPRSVRERIAERERLEKAGETAPPAVTLADEPGTPTKSKRS